MTVGEGAGGAVRLAVLNSMLGRDTVRSFDRHVELGLSDLDLKDELFGVGALDLDDEQAQKVRSLADERGLAVHCLSTQLFGFPIERGAQWYEDHHRRALDRALAVADVLRPRWIRLLACRSQGREQARAGSADAGAYLLAEAPWVLDLYREAVQRLTAAGHAVTIENDVDHCVLASPTDVSGFFTALDLGEQVRFTWDVQNMWSMGTQPSVEAYAVLRPLLCYVHLKGGRADDAGRLRWRSPLREASWPVAPILERVVADGVSPVICLNPSHGEAPSGYDRRAETEDDLAYVRELLAGGGAA